MGQVCTTGTSWIHDEWNPVKWIDGWSLDEWNDDWSVGWHEDCEQTSNTSVISFFHESSEWVKYEPGHSSYSQHIASEL